MNVPYRQNRIALFDATLLHGSDGAADWKPGYLNRRISVTFLFGRREQVVVGATGVG